MFSVVAALPIYLRNPRRFQLILPICTMNRTNWTYSSYDDHVPRCTHTANYNFRYEIERERSLSARLGSVLGFLTTILCLVVIGLIYLLYFR